MMREIEESRKVLIRDGYIYPMYKIINKDSDRFHQLFLEGAQLMMSLEDEMSRFDSRYPEATENDKKGYRNEMKAFLKELKKEGLVMLFMGYSDEMEVKEFEKRMRKNNDMRKKGLYLEGISNGFK